MARRRPMRKPHPGSTTASKSQDALIPDTTGIKTENKTETEATIDQAKREPEESVVRKLDSTKLCSQVAAESLARKDTPVPKSEVVSEVDHGWGGSGEAVGKSCGAVDLDHATREELPFSDSRDECTSPTPDVPQPVQRFPEETREALEDTRKTVPTFLFRAFSPSSGSGIEIIENGILKMVPRAYLEGGSKSIHDNIYEIPDIANMVDSHLGGRFLNTEFSSWAGSLRVSFRYLQSCDPEARLSIIDTRKFPSTAIYHAPHLSGTVGRGCSHEYLLHGVLESEGPASGYKSVLYSELKAKGIEEIMLPQNRHSLTLARARHAKHIAASYGPEFITPFTAVLLNNTKFHGGGRVPKFTKKKLEILRAVLYEGTQTTIENFSEVKNIMEDHVYVHDYPDIQHSIVLLRELTKYTHGKEAKVTDNKKIIKKFQELTSRQFWADRIFGRKGY